MPVDWPESRWHAVRTKPRVEKIVRDHLTDQGVETLLPLRKRTSQWKSRTKLIEVALFAGYCFARFSPTQRPLVLHTSGVLGILSNQDELEPTIAAEMTGMQQLVQSSIHYEAHLDRQGTTVEIIRGPLVGIRGKSLRHGDQNWVVLPVSLIGKAVAIEIAFNDLRAVSARNL